MTDSEKYQKLRKFVIAMQSAAMSHKIPHGNPELENNAKVALDVLNRIVEEIRLLESSTK